MGRSRKLTLTDWTSANNSLIQLFEGNKSKLAERAKMSRTTVTDFFNQKPVGESSFRKICFTLRLNWEHISSVITNSEILDKRSSELAQGQYIDRHNLKLFLNLFALCIRKEIQEIEFEIESLIEPIREFCREKIYSQYSHIRLLSGKEIRVDQLYVDVYLLNRSPRTFRISRNKFLESFDLRNDRLGLGDRIERTSGFNIANKNSKLVILGKPGSGKTTFLKHLAVDWCNGEFQKDSIAVVIELRKIQDKSWCLEDAICREIQLKSQQELVDLLERGSLLVLMDGLDEVATNELRVQVQKQLEQISIRYPKNRFILTCRTQIIGLIPVGFTSVEVADFNLGQVERFVRNWFMANGESSAKAKQWSEKINDAIANQPDFREMTVVPVLLSLLCLVLQDEQEIPVDRSWLYRKGIQLLLCRWNDDKQIDGWEIGTQTYRNLSVEDKEILLNEIAARKFDQPGNFVLFEQEELAEQIAQKLQLPNLREGIAVLKAIESHHGLLIERADELWSFSHLTFQEHFTVQWLNQLPSAQLAIKVSNQQWQKVVKQLVSSQQPADRLLRLIKRAIDQSVARESTIQTFLEWVLKKSESVRTKYKPTAVRALYYPLGLALELDCLRSHTLTLNFDRALDRALDPTLTIDNDKDHDLAQDYALALALARILDLNPKREDDFVPTFINDLNSTIINKLNHPLDFALRESLHQLQEALPRADDRASFRLWCRDDRDKWLQKFREVLTKSRNIGHDWQFSDEQKQQLNNYYNANKFLVDVIKIEGAVSENVYTEIETGLMLPWAVLSCRQPDIYDNFNDGLAL